MTRRGQQPGWAAVLPFQRAAPVIEGHPRLAAGDVVYGQVGGIAAITERHDIGRVVPDLVQQGVDGHPLPVGVELGPAGDAVDVDGDGPDGQRPDFLSGPGLPGLAALGDGERPLLQQGVQRRPCRQHREPVG